MAPKAPEPEPEPEGEEPTEPETGESKFVFADGSKYGAQLTHARASARWPAIATLLTSVALLTRVRSQMALG